MSKIEVKMIKFTYLGFSVEVRLRYMNSDMTRSEIKCHDYGSYIDTDSFIICVKAKDF